MKLSIIIPVYNEEQTILTVLEKITSLKLVNIEKEIIVVDDASSDNTGKKLRSIKAKKKNLKLITHLRNQGKGSAVRTGINNASGDFILIQDADLEYNPNDIVKLLVPIQDGKAKVVYGTRLNRLPNFTRDERTIQFFIHYIGNRFLSLLTSILYHQWITDMETGYKIFPKQAALEMKLNAKSFDFEPEITSKLLKSGYKILEIPITTNPRGYNEGKKLNTITDGIFALWTLIKYKFLQ